MDKTVARLTIFKASELSYWEKRQISDWLYQQAANLEQDGWNYSDKYIARYLYGEEEATKL